MIMVDFFVINQNNKMKRLKALILYNLKYFKETGNFKFINVYQFIFYH